MDTNTSRYWTICVISTRRYTEKQSTVAKIFFENEFPQFSSQKTLFKRENQYIQAHLWQMFHNDNFDREQRALAGLCLRCYVSYVIIKGCRIIEDKNSHTPNLFAELLPYVLNDDGSTFIVMDSDDKTQLKLNRSGETQIIPQEGKFFSVEILKNFNPNLPNNKTSESLDNWGIRLINKNKNLQDILLELGVWIPSNWSLLCRNIPRNLDSHFTDNERYCIEVFHAVYRRDRRISSQKGKYSEPTDVQLEEMRCLLQDRKIILGSNKQLTELLEIIAERLYYDEYYTRTGTTKANSIESVSQDEDNNVSSILDKLSTNNLNCEDIEEAGVRNLLKSAPPRTLRQAIPLKISKRVTVLSESRNYSAFAQRFVEGLQLYYRINNPLSLKEIAEVWEIDWAKARRIFKLSEFIGEIQEYVEVKSMEIIKDKASNFFVNEISCNPNYLREIAQELREYLYKIIFQEAYAELTASRTLYKNSLFAQALRQYINNQRSVA